MKIKNRKLLTLILIVVLVLSQSLCVYADDMPTYDKSLFYTYGEQYAYEGYIVTYLETGSNPRYVYTTFASNEEVVLYMGSPQHDTVYQFATLTNGDKAKQYIKGYELNNGIYESASGTNVYDPYNSSYDSNGRAQYHVIYNSIKIFDTKEHAQAYLDNGSLEGLVRGESVEYNADEIYLDNFYFEVHDSNSLEEFYITFYYTPSDYLVQNGGSVLLDYNLVIDFDWLSGMFECSSIDLGGTLELPCSSGDMVYSWDVSADDFWEINEGGNFFEILGDTWTNEFIEEAVLGDEAFIDFDGISIGEFGGNSILKIEKSNCDIVVYPVLDSERGKTYTGIIDFLNPQNSYYSSNTPDSNGNYVNDGNYTQQDGYYYTEVSQDNYGNNTYNYYYITDNSRTEIDSGSSGGSGGNGIQHHYHEHKHDVNVNVNGSFGGGSSGSSNDVTIEDDDLTPDGLRSAIEDGYGLFDLVSTEKDNDGFLSLLTAFMGSLDDDMNNLIGFGMGTTVVLAIILRLLNR